MEFWAKFFNYSIPYRTGENRDLVVKDSSKHEFNLFF